MLNSIDAALIIGISLPTLIMATRIKRPPFRVLTVLLSAFLLFHGLYHLTGSLGTLAGYDWLGDVSDTVFEPFGWLFFFAFAAYLGRKSA